MLKKFMSYIAKSQSYSPKVRATAEWIPKSESNRPKQASESEILVVLQKRALKPFRINPN